MNHYTFGRLEIEEDPDAYSKQRQQNIATFLFRVYSLLSMELVYTTILVSILNFSQGTRHFMLQNYALAICAGVWTIVCVICLVIFKKRYPLNVVFLGMFLTGIAYLLAVTCAALHEKGQTELIFISLFCTIVTFVCLSLFTILSNVNFTFMRGYLFAGLTGLVAWGLMGILFGFTPGVFYSLFGVILFPLYVVFDTSQMIKNYPTVDAIEASVDLYLDIVNLFLHLIRLLQYLTGKE
jgi:protein lifeguard